MADRLQVGQQLNINDRLVSPNGIYTLLMQTDGNLVLYQDAIDVSTAYWATNTWALPANERPTSALIQVDAHFVLYDANGVARWASGTWGPGYVAPYVALEDDGNLIIYHDGTRPLWASGGVGGTGAIPARGYLPAPATGDLNSAIDSLGRMPRVVAGSTDLAPPTQASVDVNSVAYLVTEQRRRTVNDVVEHAFLQDIAAMGVWPGQVIQGKSLLVGDVAPVGPFVRQPGTDLANNLATPALSEARQKRETSPRSSRPAAKDGSVVGAGFVARTILPAGNRNREERSCTKRRSPS
jgi:hypothetical protein